MGTRDLGRALKKLDLRLVSSLALQPTIPPPHPLSSSSKREMSVSPVPPEQVGMD